MARPDEADPALEQRIRQLAGNALGAVQAVHPIAGQLGLRRFYRVTFASGPVPTLIARIEQVEDPGGRPTGLPPEPPLEPIRALLARHGLPVPKRYGGDSAAGIELIEDLGDVSLQQKAATASPAERATLYTAACGLVPRLQAIEDPGTGIAAFRRQLDAALFAYKADLFVRYALGARPKPSTPAERGVARAAFDLVAGEAMRAPQRLAHRDFQSANLHCVEDRGLVMIDFQGAFLAPPEYDLVCLLRDSYVELPEAEVAQHLQQVRPLLPDGPDADTFARRFDLLTLTRKGKDLARFHYAATERGDPRYLRFAPATLRSLRAAAARAAARDAAFRGFADLCHSLEAATCAR